MPTLKQSWGEWAITLTSLGGSVITWAILFLTSKTEPEYEKALAQFFSPWLPVKDFFDHLIILANRKHVTHTYKSFEKGNS